MDLRRFDGTFFFAAFFGVPFNAWEIHGFLYLDVWYIVYIYHGPPKPTFLEVFVVNNLVFRWPKPLFFMVLGAHGIYIYLCIPGGGFNFCCLCSPRTWGEMIQSELVFFFC